jgi:hypothetical protein
MDIHQERFNYFKDFAKGHKVVYVINSKPETAEVTHLTFRKLDSGRTAILAWMDKDKAESWRKENNLEKSQVIVLTYSELMRWMKQLEHDQRKLYTIELI